MPIAVTLDRDQGRNIVTKACRRGQSAEVRFSRPDGPAAAVPTALLAIERDALFIKRPVGPHGPVEPVPGDQVQITFNVGGRRFSLETAVKDPGICRLDTHTNVDAIPLDYPQRVCELQRRAEYRVPLWNTAPITAHLEPLPLGGSDGTPLAEPFHGRLQNISAGGVAVLVDRSVRACLAGGQHYLLEFFLPGGEEPFAFAVSVRHVRRIAHSNDRLIGLKFMPGDDGEPPRRAIQRVREVVETQRRLKPDPATPA